MKTTQNGVYGFARKLSTSKCEYVDDSRVPTASDHYQSFTRVENERLILRNCVLDQPLRRQYLSAYAPVPLRVLTWYWSGQPRSRKDVSSPVMLDEFSASRLVLFSYGAHVVI